MKLEVLVSGLVFYGVVLLNLHQAGSVPQMGAGRLILFALLVAVGIIWIEAGILARKDQWSNWIDLVLVIIAAVFLLSGTAVYVH